MSENCDVVFSRVLETSHVDMRLLPPTRARKLQPIKRQSAEQMAAVGAMAAMDSPWGDISEQKMYEMKAIETRESMFRAARLGINLYTKTWLPQNEQPRAVICMIHGYGNDINWTFQNTAIHFASAMKLAAVAVDLQGHGKSDGLRAFVPDVQSLASDCASLFDSECQKPPLKGLCRFLYGESMGGAICLLIHLQNPSSDWRGAVLVAPMCRISDRIRPSWPVSKLLIAAAWLLPALAVVPLEDLIEKCVKSPEKREIARRNPRRYIGRPRLGTSLELLRVTDYLAARLGDIDLPFIVLHGDADVVTDPDVSRELSRAAKSSDKMLKVYEGLGHSLLFGEADDRISAVLHDICDWISRRIPSEN